MSPSPEPENEPDPAASPEATPEATDGAADDDFYMEAGFLVFTAAYLQRRGYCCGNGCRHCPYPKDDVL